MMWAYFRIGLLVGDSVSYWRRGHWEYNICYQSSVSCMNFYTTLPRDL